MKIGTAASFGNTGDLISVRLENGTYVQVVAGNVINSSKVLVVDGYAWSETSPQQIMELYEWQQFREGGQTEEEETETIILPFQVLFISNGGVWLGGDRIQIPLINLSALAGGVNNLGNLEFLAAWEQTDCQVIQNLNFISTENILPGDFCPLPSAYWIGAGVITTDVQRAEVPERTYQASGETPDGLSSLEPAIALTGEELPSTIEVPMPNYPRFNYPATGFKVGTRQETIVDSEANEYNYNYLKEETWDWQHTIGGTAGAFPLVSFVNVLCDFFTVGRIHTETFDRNTGMDYRRTIAENAQKDVRIWWNNQAFLTVRNEDYNESLVVVQTPALFISTAYYQCYTVLPGIFGIYGWKSNGGTAHFSGETTTTTHSWNRTTTEELEHPLTNNIAVISKYNLTENYQDDRTLTFPDQDWNIVEGFAFNPTAFDFRVEGGQETRAYSQTTVEEKDSLKPLLLSKTGIEAIAVEEQKMVDRQLSATKISPMTLYCYNYSTSAVIPTTWTETTVVKQQESKSLVYFNGEEYLPISLDNSFLFNIVNSGLSAALGGMTLENENANPIHEQATEFFTEYTEIKDLTDPTNHVITYQDVSSTPATLWDNLIGRDVYLLASNVKALAMIVGIDYEDEVDEAFPLETIRKLNSISINILSIEEYPNSIENNNFFLYPADDVTSRIFGILNSGDRNYCNLIGDKIYYSESVASRLDQNEQTAEVFQIVDNSIIQISSEGGAFIPVNNVGTILGVSYSPIR